MIKKNEMLSTEVYIRCKDYLEKEINKDVWSNKEQAKIEVQNIIQKNNE